MSEITDFNPRDWYWVVGFTGADDPATIDFEAEPAWSTRAGAMVPADDPDYAAWRAAGGTATRIASDAELGAVLAPYGLDRISFPRLSRVQLLIGMHGLGVSEAAVETAIIGAMAEPARAHALIRWRNGASFERNDPLIAGLVMALGLEGASVDAARRMAATA